MSSDGQPPETTTPTARPPEAQLIYEHRKAMRLSIREAARRAGISEASWRRTEGSRELVRTAQTLARMGRVTGVQPQRFTAIGRQDAAEEMERQLTGPPPLDPRMEELREIMKRANELAAEITHDRGGPSRATG